MAEKKGICKNVVNCPLADAEEIQVADEMNFVCSKCGQPLEELDSQAKGGGIDPSKKKLILIIAVAVVVLGGGIAGAVFGLKGSNAKENAPIDKTSELSLVINQEVFDMKVGDVQTVTAECQPVDVEATISYKSDDEKVAMVSQTGEIHAIAEGETFITVTAQPQSGDAVIARANITVNKKSGNVANGSVGNGSGSSNLGWGRYTGPMQGGKPHGVGGTINVSSAYSIDLKDGKGTKLQVNPGETIENTKFEDGRLRAGELHRNDGTRKWFNC